jgi:hypothetical protein
LSIKSSGAKMFFFLKKKKHLNWNAKYYTILSTQKKVKEFDTLVKSYPIPLVLSSMN